MFTKHMRTALVAVVAVISFGLPVGVAMASPKVDFTKTGATGSASTLSTPGTRRAAYFAVKEEQAARADGSGMRLRDRARTARSARTYKSLESYAQFKQRQMERLLK